MTLQDALLRHAVITMGGEKFAIDFVLAIQSKLRCPNTRRHCRLVKDYERATAHAESLCVRIVETADAAYYDLRRVLSSLRGKLAAVRRRFGPKDANKLYNGGDAYWSV